MSKKIIIALILSALVLSGCQKTAQNAVDTDAISESASSSSTSKSSTTTKTTTVSSDNSSSETTTTTDAASAQKTATYPAKTAAPNTLGTQGTQGQSQVQIPLSAHPSTLGGGKWYLTLVNYQYSIPAGFSVNLGTITNGIKVDARIVESYYAMERAARADGVYLNPSSGYRSVEYQRSLFNSRVNQYMSSYGYSRAAAEQKVATYTARPGTSEHNLGLAIDFYDSSTALTSAFENTKQGKWLNANSYKYGFILRYSSSKSSITGIIYEPWHFRFVGVEDATKIYNSGLCLEEYLSMANQTTTTTTTTTPSTTPSTTSTTTTTTTTTTSSTTSTTATETDVIESDSESAEEALTQSDVETDSLSE